MLQRFPSEIMPALMPNLWDSLVPGLSVQHTGDCPGRVQMQIRMIFKPVVLVVE